MPKALVNGVNLYYEEAGEGDAILFSHEFAGDYRSWEPQLRAFSRRYRCITYSVRGYLPSDVPERLEDYSEEQNVADLLGLMDHLGLDLAHLVGLSMGAGVVLKAALAHPHRIRSVVFAGGGYGSSDKAGFVQLAYDLAERYEREGSAAVAADYARGAARLPFLRKDPRGWQEFHDQLASHSALGAAMTMRQIQARRRSVTDTADELPRLQVPILILVGDEDDLAIEGSMLLKRRAPRAGLHMFPRSGHTLNLEEPELFNRAMADFLAAVETDSW